MKKLVVIMISGMMILFTSAVSVKANTDIGVGLDYGKNFSTGKNIGKATIVFTAQTSKTTQATVDLSADWTPHAKNPGVVALDDAMIALTEKFGTLTFGFFDVDTTEIELLDPDSLDEEGTDSELTVSLESELSRQTAILLTVSTPPGGLDYSAGITYEVAKTSTGITLNKNAADTEWSYTVNGSYTIKAVKIYLTFQSDFSGNAENRRLTLGVQSDPADNPFYWQAEYDLENQGQQSHNHALKIGFKISKGVRLEYNWTHQNVNSGSDDQSLKIRISF